MDFCSHLKWTSKRECESRESAPACPELGGNTGLVIKPGLYSWTERVHIWRNAYLTPKNGFPLQKLCKTLTCLGLLWCCPWSLSPSPWQSRLSLSSYPEESSTNLILLINERLGHNSHYQTWLRDGYCCSRLWGTDNPGERERQSCCDRDSRPFFMMRHAGYPPLYFSGVFSAFIVAGLDRTGLTLTTWITWENSSKARLK